MDSDAVEAGDCRDGLPRLCDESVSLTLTDPPYFTDGLDEGWDMGRIRSRMTEGVVSGIPAGQRFDAGQGRALQEFMTPIAQEIYRVLKPGGFLLCFSNPRLTHRMGTAIEDAGFEVRDLLAWHHGEGQSKAFSPAHFARPPHLSEQVERLQGLKTPQLKPDMEMVVMARKPVAGTLVENWMTHGTGLVDFRHPVIYPSALMTCPKPKERHGHPTAKPVKLMRHLIRMFSAPRSVVLDPFAGSGTTGVAAVVEGRQFMGFERDAEMAVVANRRIDDAQAEPLEQMRLTDI